MKKLVLTFFILTLSVQAQDIGFTGGAGGGESFWEEDINSDLTPKDSKDIAINEVNIVNKSATAVSDSSLNFVDGGVNTGQIRVEKTGTGAVDGEMSFLTREDGGSLEERLKIHDNGNVNIGGLSSLDKLNVDGNISLIKDGEKFIRGFSGSTTDGRLIVTAGANQLDGASIEFHGKNNLSAPGTARIISDSSTGFGEVQFLNWNGSSSTQTLTISTDGDVGIGVTSPTQELDVNGAIKIGTTANDVAGSIRYNSTTGKFQGYNGVLAQWDDLN